jgi:uncharacterized protein YndB with AHSA1/START domain
MWSMMTEPGVVRRTPHGYEVTFERHVKHAPERLWAALTEPDQVRTWFCARVEIDHRPGGEIVEHHDHVNVDVHGRVTRWEPPAVFEHTWWIGDSSSGPMGWVRWEIVPEKTGSQLVLTLGRPDPDAGGISGAHTYLDVLCDVLNGADPTEHAAPEGEFRDGEFVETRPGRGRWTDRRVLEQHYDRAFARLKSAAKAGGPGRARQQVKGQGSDASR